MQFARKYSLFCSIILLLPLAACSFSLVGDITPPPTYQPPIPTEANVTTIPSPEVEIEITPTQAEQENTPLTESADKIIFTGEVLNESGGQIPEGMTVALQGIETMELVIELETEVSADGFFIFPAVERVDGQVFIASLDYDENFFSSEIVYAADTVPGDIINLTIPIYEKTSDTSALIADRAHLFLDVSIPGGLQIVTYLLVSNPDKYIVAGPGTGQPVLTFELPDGARNFQFDNSILGERFILTDNGLGDMMAIRPGLQQHEILFSYDLPYENKASLSVTFPIPVTMATIVIPDNGLHLKSDQLMESGQRNTETGVVNLFTASEIQAGSEIELSISGIPGGELSDTAGSTKNLAIGLGVFALVLLTSVIWFLRNQKGRDAGEAEIPDAMINDLETKDSLLSAIIDLDEQYENGELSLHDYEKRRSELKERLKIVIDGQ
ncbi:MAG: hypothetical protein MUO76_04920 [Anaerolineaceae bacterium]|nr:hypothetical protein [Anaerolineaceae bacterium]